MNEAFSRTELLLGREAMEKLAAAKVAIFGIGGVGSYAAEGLARAGIGSLILVDDDSVNVTNLNRQIIALRSTLGKPKVEVMKARILDINPEAKVDIFQEYYDTESAPRLLGQDLVGSAGAPGGIGISYVVDAIDSVSSKIDLIVRATTMGIPIISSMGAGNKLDPTRLEVADIYQTSVCPLARVMRTELRKRGVAALEVVYSREPPIKVEGSAPAGRNRLNAEADAPDEAEPSLGRRSVPGSMSFVPSVAGLIIASRVVRRLVGA
jgi:tRNA A37 threonylcarbamoyladenosine dehydratase